MLLGLKTLRIDRLLNARCIPEHLGATSKIGRERS